MLKFGVIVLLLVCLPETVADTCNECKAAYGTAKAAAGDDPAKCAALVTYLHCLEGSGKDDAGCPLPKADSDAIEADYVAASCNGVAAFTDTCKCQKNFWATDVETGGASAVCSATTAYIACLKGKTALACDGSTTVVALATGVETRITNLGNSSCAVSTACQCEINAATADISDNAKKCTAYKAELSCLRTTQSTGCDGTTTKSAIATASEEARAALPIGDCLALTPTCQCEVNAAKGDASTSAKYCTVLTTLKTCLSAINTTTEAGCTATTQAALLTDTNTKITAATCGSAADHVTFATTSLIVSVLVNMFL